MNAMVKQKKVFGFRCGVAALREIEYIFVFVVLVGFGVIGGYFYI